MTLPRTIVVGTDFSEHAEHALEYAVELAQRLDAKLHVVHAITVPALGVPEMGIAYSSMVMESTVEKSQGVLSALADRHRARVPSIATHLEIGDARDVIDRIAETVGADLIVLGTHGRRGIRRLLLGSVAESVVRSAPCSVLTIRVPKPS